MSRVVRREHYYVTRWTTGPQDLLLMLDLESERIADPFVTALDVCSIYGNPDDATVRAAVLDGTDEANSAFGTSWHPLEMKYSYSGYDTKHCRLMARAAFEIVKEVAQRGPAGIELVTA